MLKIQFKDKRQDPIWIVDKRFSIGRTANNQLSIDDDSLDEVHARLLTKNHQLFLKDNQSQRGSYVNEQRVTEKRILPGDTIRLGDIELLVLGEQSSSSGATNLGASSEWSLVADSSWLSGQEYKIPEGVSVIGRSSECDITIPGTHLSRRHAQFTLSNQQLQICDLGSANGTYINDKKISEISLKSGDQLRMDLFSFRIIGPGTGEDETRIRSLAVKEPSPVAIKPVSDEPKQWITKPTSPGNREEPAPPKKSYLMTALSIVLLLMVVSIFIFLLAIGN